MLTERAINFHCAGDPLVGIVHLPDAPAEVGVIVVVGGPQYRVGAHRQFVQLARALSGAGYAVLRFDVRGMGDSGGAPRRFDALDDDVAAAIDALLAQSPAIRRVVLWGLCDGASAALLYLDARGDPRVAGVAALNPWVRSEATLARAQLRHYYGQRLRSGSFWAKLLRGGVGAAALAELARKLALALRGRRPIPAESHFAERMARGASRLDRGGLLVVLSENDLTAKEFAEHAARSPAWQRALETTAGQRHDIAAADHTLSQRDARLAVEAVTLRWLEGLCAPARTPAAAEPA